MGCGVIPTSTPIEWVKEHQVLVVAVNYRLGLLGFLGNGENTEANAGLQDVIEALKWLQNHAQFFGGHPKKVTLLGQSSGADLAAHLMLVEGSEKWFQQLILHSAPLGLRENRQRMAQKMVENAQRLYPDYKNNVLAWIEKFSNVKPSFFKYGFKAAMPFGLQYNMWPLCREDQVLELWKKKAAYFRILIGANEEETAFYLRTHPFTSSWEKNSLGKKIIKRLIAFSTEHIYSQPAHDLAQMWADYGAQVWTFSLHNIFKENTLGACHCYELPFLFGDYNSWKNAELTKNFDHDLWQEHARYLRKKWTEFIQKGAISCSNSSALLRLKRVKKQ